MSNSIRIGCGAGFSGDRLDPSIVLVEQGQLDYLVLECLAERTIALAQKRKRQDPSTGFDSLLERRITSLIEPLARKKVRLITNMGAANPLAALDKVVDIARQKKISLTVAAITGDDVLERINPDDRSLETDQPLRLAGNLVSANAYLGMEGILEALASGADIIITGRVADPSLFLAPMMHAFNWRSDDFPLLGQGTVLGHLMECAGQVTGGYYADPGKKDVPGLSALGHPIMTVFPNGQGILTKVAGTGGLIHTSVVKEQLLYEVVNPHEYKTPDVIADFTGVKLVQQGVDEVHISGGSGKTKPGTYKVSVGYQAFYLGEGEITYAGENALGRARLAASIIQERLQGTFPELRLDLIGLNSVHGDRFHGPAQPYEVRLRAAGKAQTSDIAALVGEEMEALYTNGPAGGGGVRKYVQENIGILSTLLPRESVHQQVTLYTT